MNYEAFELIVAAVGFLFIGGMVGLKMGYEFGYDYGFADGQKS